MTAEYTVLDGLAHDNVDYAPGDVLRLPDGVAAPLVALGVVRRTDAPPPAAPDPAAPDAATDPVVAQLVVAIDGLDADDEEAWTTDGRPEVRALARAAGLRRVSAAQRDAAWAARQAAEAEGDAP